MKTALALMLFIAISISTCAQCTGSVGDPIVNNTFGAGAANPGPALSTNTTNLVYVTTTCPQDGQYTIANYTTGCFGGWITLTDHTGNANGYYMLINSNPNPNTFFKDTIDNLCPGVTYEFAAWIINVVARTGYIEPNLTFQIKTTSGTVLQTNTTGTIPISGTTWGRHNFNFTTPTGVTSVILSISNNATGGSGNDLAIDDITFRPVGPRIDVGIQGYTVDTVSFCGSISALTLTSAVTPCYASTDYQWQRSTNGGTTWTDIPGATSATYLPGISVYGTYLYRLAVSAHGNINSLRCRVVSTVISITYNPGPTISLSPQDTTVCPGRKVIITASGVPGTYTWSDGHQGPVDTVTVNSASSYIVSVTSAGCTSIDTARTHIGTIAAPSITVTGTAHCPTDSLTMTASGGTGYVWSTSATSPAIKVYPVPTRIYTVTATDLSGCTASASVTPPAGTPWSFTGQVVNPPCPGRNTGTVTVSVGGGGTYHYSWSNGDTQSMADSLSPGLCTVTVSDGGHCDTVLRFTLVSGTFLSINTRDTTICPGKQVRLIASGGTGQYQWVNGPTTATNTVTANTDSIFVVHMTGAAGGCPSADTAHIHIRSSTQPVITQQAPQRCAGDSITLLATGGTGYTWSNTATTSSIRILPVSGTIYYVTATAPNLCSAAASFTVQAKTRLAVTATATNPPCPGRDMGVIRVNVSGATPPYHYLWSNGDTLAQADSLAAGPYAVTVTDAGGCDTVLNFTLTYGTLLSINTRDTTICPGKQVRLIASGGTGQYQWVNGPTTATHTVTANTDSIFVVHMTGAAGGCPSADTAHIHIQNSTQPVITQQAPQRCAGDSITLLATGGTGYTWSNTATTSSIRILPVSGTIYYVTATAPNLCSAAASFTVQAKTRLAVAATATNPPCPGRDMGVIRVNVSGATPPYHYLWSNGDTLAQADSLAAGPYAVTVTDAGGCDTVLNFTLTYGTFLSINTRDTTICPGKQVRLIASGGTGQYQWVNGPTTATNTVTANTDSIFVVHMTGAAGGCPSADTAHIHIQNSTQPVITQQAPQRCAGDSITLLATGGTGYTWSNTATTSSIRILPVSGTTYYVTATAPNLCSAVASFTVQAKTRLAVTATATNPPCPGRDMGVIRVNVSGATPPYHYLWSNGDTLAQADSLAAGPYAVTVTDAGGCDTVLNFTLTYGTFLSINTRDTTICPGKQVRLIASGGTGQYQWVNGPTTATNTVTANTDSIFVVHMTGAAGGCPSADTAHIHIQNSTQPVITQQAPQRCAGDSITLLATGGTGYTWSNTATTSSVTIVPLTGGIYYVTATAPGLCPATASYTVQAKTPMSITPSVADPPCRGRDIGSIDLSAGGHIYHYTWTTGDTSSHAGPLAPGSYSVTVSDGTGCDTILHFDLAYAYTLQVTAYPQDTTVPSGITVQLHTVTNLDNSNTYLWTPRQDLSCYDCPAPDAHAVDSTYTFIVLVTDQNGCTAADSLHITTFPLGPVYIPNAFTPNGDNNNDFFQIFGPSVSREYIPEFEVKVFDRWGELVFESTDPVFQWDGVYKGNPMPPGAYVYLVTYRQLGTIFGKHIKGSLTLIR